MLLHTQPQSQNTKFNVFCFKKVTSFPSYSSSFTVTPHFSSSQDGRTIPSKNVTVASTGTAKARVSHLSEQKGWSWKAYGHTQHSHKRLNQALLLSLKWLTRTNGFQPYITEKCLTTTISSYFWSLGKQWKSRLELEQEGTGSSGNSRRGSAPCRTDPSDMTGYCLLNPVPSWRDVPHLCSVKINHHIESLDKSPFTDPNNMIF